ncbi:MULTISPECIES: daptide biosynthesis RiPP recognition protein [unclassified Streptomyces]|uniref:daptide biosynthesis RiPP recognition protein n=1 Tax=unclassified Streptomyces TaxID=2593676 RepID=UPI001660C4A1|nr:MULTISPECIES: daptide biosynthesis RiPP recognition protein [unclassified Streptomyces]
MSWVTGHAADRPVGRSAARTVVLEDAGHLKSLLESDVVDAETLVFAPGRPEGLTGPTVVAYEGSLAEPGMEFSHDPGFYLQIQAYGVSEYMSVVGATAIRVADATDFELYLRDADRARNEGVFPEFLTAPVVQLADLPGLGALPGPDGPWLRLYVDESGRMSTSPGGAPLGKVGDGFDRIVAEWSRVNDASASPCAVCLGATVPEEYRVRELAERPWLGRYLAVLHGIRDLRARGLNVTGVSGFGSRLVNALGEVPDPADAVDPGLPLLLWAGDEVYAHSPLRARSFRLNRDTAETVEALLVCGSPERASEYAGAADVATVLGQFEQAGVPLLVNSLVVEGK